MSLDGRDTRPPRPPRPRRYSADPSARRSSTLADLVLPFLLLSGLYYSILTLDTNCTLCSSQPNERAHDFPNILHYPNDSSSSTLRFYNDSIRLLTNASTSHVSLSSLENSSCIRPIDVCPLHRYPNLGSLRPHHTARHRHNDAEASRTQSCSNVTRIQDLLSRCKKWFHRATGVFHVATVTIRAWRLSVERSASRCPA